jgi:conjugal transfer pilus assembly protein TraB
MDKPLSIYPAPNNLYPASEDLTPQIITPPKFIGEIIHQEFAIDIPKTKKLKSVRLPPSFMKGYLMTGMDAPTLENNENKPGPMMIRVQAPAVLPNSVKKDLKGCFVIAEGTGNLATHRVDARLVSLSCVSDSGKSVIFEKIRGYVQDSDGKRGLAGVVVHRAGALIARSMISGAFTGIGSALSQSAQTNNLSSIGVSSTKIDGNGALGRSALGGAITNGSKNVSDLFLDLASQSSPIIEIGAGKHIDVIITELVTLQIQEL